MLFDPILEATELEMEMRGAGVAAFPYISDAITRLYELTGSDSSAEQMGVKGLPAIAMIQ